MCRYIISYSSWYIKVIGSRSRSQEQKACLCVLFVGGERQSCCYFDSVFIYLLVCRAFWRVAGIFKCSVKFRSRYMLTYFAFLWSLLCVNFYDTAVHLSDIDWCSRTIRQLSEPTASNSLKLDLYCQRQKWSPGSPVFDNTWFMRDDARYLYGHWASFSCCQVW